MKSHVEHHKRRTMILFAVVMSAVALTAWAIFFVLDRQRLPPTAVSVKPSAPIAGSAAVTGTLPVSEDGPKPSEPLLVDDFETGATQGLFEERKNRLDAFQGTWARRPSYSVITKVPDTRPNCSGKALRIEYSKSGGWCGWYTLLNGIDVTPYNALTFWVKGERGGERFDIGLADDSMQDLEIDAIYAGSVKAFLPQGVTTQWQQVKVPLAGLRSDLNLARMGSLVLWFRYEGSGAIQIDDVAFAYDEQIQRIQSENLPVAAQAAGVRRSMWVWKYDPVASEKIREDLLEFCKRTAVDILYVYLGEEPASRMPESFQKGLAQFLRQAHEQKIEVEALQGNPLWALEPHHPQVTAWVQGYLEFNEKRPPEERIDGVSLDIEPYLTSEWETGDREKLKKEFVQLMTALRKLIDSKKGDSHFYMGLAVPIFYSREPDFEEALLRQVDYLALMDYYDAAVDIIENGKLHLELAAKAGKKVFIGVETQDLVQMAQGKRRNTFHEEGWLEMEVELAKVVSALGKHPGFGGLAIHAYDSYRLLQKPRNVPTRERSPKIAGAIVPKATSPIQIDGKLSEWADSKWMKVDQKGQVVYGAGAWGWGQDMSFSAAYRWEPDALLVALDVTDDTHVQEKQKADMWEGDHMELWIDADLLGDYSEALNSGDDFQIGISPGNFGNLPPEAHVWVPTVDPASTAQIQVGALKKEKGYSLEIRLPTEFLFQNVTKRVGVEPLAAEQGKFSPAERALQKGTLDSGQLKPGFKLGLMVDGSDTDNARQPQKSMMSTSTERQWGDPTTFNILELQ